MLRILMITLLVLAGCGRAGDDPAPSPAPVDFEPTDSSVQLAGKQAYDEVCASCHDEGVDGAPKTGDQEAWAGRSWLWEAVLFEHAKDGYLDMPAKGGEDKLEDSIVEMAAEYMLTKTFPDAQPAD